MKTRTRTQFTGTKAWVRRHRDSKASCAREERAIEKAARRQGKRECAER